MSKECCEPVEPVRSATIGQTTADTCCGEPVAVDVCCTNGHVTTAHDTGRSWWRDRGLLVPLAAGLGLACGYILTWLGVERVSTAAFASSLIAGASTFAPGALRRLTQRRVGVGLLMTIAALGAVALGRVGEAAALAFLFSIAEALEERAMTRARHGLRALLSLMPQNAVVARGLTDVEVLAAELRTGDMLVVRAGERIATDGVVATGRSSVDASAITGESIPLAVGPGSPVPAGSINGGGALRIEATADGRDNSLTTIVRLVEQAQARKGAQARLADRIARPLVPIVLGTAALIVLYGVISGDPTIWVERALVVLVAVSPCALAIAVPVTVISAIGAASRFGVVIKSGEAFERLGGIEIVAFDKTGTLTRNQPRVVEVVIAAAGDRATVLNMAAALEASSNHPLAAALLREVPAPEPAQEVVELPGEGVAGRVGDRVVRLGSTRWIPSTQLKDQCVRLEHHGMTVVAVEVDHELVGLVGIRDELRPEAIDAVDALHRRGIRTVMLTGDNDRTARALGLEVGITDVRSELLPRDKALAIEDLRTGGLVAMIGDGINDEPALAAADVGIAMGATGAAAAIESADVAFTGHDLRLIPEALRHARRGRLIMTGNIVLALAIVVTLFPLALFGIVGLAGVVLIHESAEIVVIGNGVRAARGRPSISEAPRLRPATLELELSRPTT